MKQKVKISIHNWDEEVDIQELAQLTFIVWRAQGRIRNPNGAVERIKQDLRRIRDACDSVVILARSKEKLVGWLWLNLESPSLVRMGSWHPVISPGCNEDEIASKLVEQGIDYTMNEGRKSLEIALEGLTEEAEQRYTKYKTWYEAHGIHKLSEEVYMECILSEFEIEDAEFLTSLDGLRLKPLTETNNDEIHECYYKIVKACEERLFLNETVEQRRDAFNEYFDRTKALIEEASFVLLKDEQIIGFSVVRPRAEAAHLSPFGIHPDFRGKGLEESLLLLSMKNLADQGIENMTVDVDVEDCLVFELYQSFGFKTVSRTIIHCWQEA